METFSVFLTKLRDEGMSFYPSIEFHLLDRIMRNFLGQYSNFLD
jgi:hypothetical protein